MRLVNVGRRYLGIVVGLIVCGTGATRALAATEYFDTNGATADSGITANGSYKWEDPNWNIAGTNDANAANGVSPTGVWTEGDFPRFAAGINATGLTYTVTANSSHTIAGMQLLIGAAYTGGPSVNGGTQVNVNTGSGAVLSIGPGYQGINVSTAGTLNINASLGEADSTTRLIWGGGGGSLNLYGDNSALLHGVTLNASNGLNFNSAKSFGPATAPISFLDQATYTSIFSTGTAPTTYVLADPLTGQVPITVPNPMNWRSDANTTLIYTGAAAVTFNNMTLGTGVNNTLTVANTAFPSAKMIVNNLGGAANNFILQTAAAANGTLVLTGNTTYAGNVQIGGNTALTSGQPTLQADDGMTLSNSSFLILNGGVLQTSGTFSRDIATAGAGRVEFNTNGGGFSAIGSLLTVNLGANNGFPNFEVAWNPTLGFGLMGPLRFGSVSTNAKTLFVNPIDMIAPSGTTRTISVVAGTGNDYTEINQIIRNSQNSDAPLQKTGTGTLLLSAANSYAGATQITGGALQAVQGTGLPTASLVSLDGGVYEGVGTTSFTRSFGTSGTAVQWTANGGGFSANGGQMTVNIGNSSAQAVWGTTVGSQIVGPLVFGSHTANAKTVFQNPIDLDNTGTAATRTVTVNSGAGGDSAEISGALSNSSAAAILVKNGAGTLLLSAANSYTGGTTLSAGTLALGNAGALPSSGPLTLGGGTLSNVSGSAIVAPNVTTMTANTTLTGTSALTLNGGFTNSGANRTLTVSNTAGTTLGAINLSEAAATGRTLTLAGNGNVTITGPIQNASAAGVGNGALTFNSAFHGTATLSGASTYTGATTISGGTVLVTNTSGSATGTGAVTTAAAVTLGGTGTIGGNVTNKGILSPGVGGIGTLSIGGNLTDSASSSWSIDLSGASADKVAVTGNIDLTAADTLNVSGAGTGSSWLIGTYAGTLNGTFDTVTSGYTVSYAGGNITLNTVGGGGLAGDYNGDGSVDAADYVVWRNGGSPNPNSPADYDTWRANFGNHLGAGSGLGGSAVPEPATLGMLLLALVAMVPRRSR